MALVRRRDNQRLFQRGETFLHAVKRDHAERMHSLADGDFADFARVGARNDELADGIRHGHGLDDGHTARVSGIFAAIATAPAVKLNA